MSTEKGRPKRTHRPRTPEAKARAAARNRAHTNEKQVLPGMLSRLCRSLKVLQPPDKKERLPFSEMLFCLNLKVYLRVSFKNLVSFLNEMLELKYITRIPFYNSFGNYMNLEWLTGLLMRLVEKTNAILRGRRVHAAVDSTKLFFEGEHQEQIKKGRMKGHMKWVPNYVRLHVIVDTYLILAARVSVWYEDEKQFFGPLLREACERAHVLTIAGDKNYCSEANLKIAEDLGCTPYLYPKKNYKEGPEKSPAWNANIQRHREPTEDDQKRIHKRKRVETTFSIIKVRFYAWLFSKNLVAQINEGLCMVICHNLRALIFERELNGTEPIFPPDEGVEAVPTRERVPAVEDKPDDNNEKGGYTMPRIDDDTQNWVIYLYRTAEDAWAGRRAGGGGFLLALDSAVILELRLLYAVTTGQVIRSGFPVIRADSFNRPAAERPADLGRRGLEIYPFEKSAKDWVYHPAGEDVAACLLGPASDYPQLSYHRVERFLTSDLFDRLGVGVGSDVFLMGRHITMRDVQCPAPKARFGKLAMTDRRPVRQPDGQMRECFLAAVFEPGEHSGAPVFVTTAHPLDQDPASGSGSTAAPWLLGIGQGHLQDFRSVVDARGERHPRGWKVPTPNGLIAITPAWRLRELLGAERLVNERRRFESQAGVTRGGSALESGVGEFMRDAFLNPLRSVSCKTGAVSPEASAELDVDQRGTQRESGQPYTLEDFEADFPDEYTCVRWLTDYLYPGGIYCRNCQHITQHAKVASRRSFSCDWCGHHVHPTVSTIYHGTRKPLRPWFEAIYWIAANPGRTTAEQLRQKLGVNYKTAYRMRRKIREMLSKKQA